MDTVSGSVSAGTVSGDFQGFTNVPDTLFGKGFASQFLTIPSTSAAGSFSLSGSATGFSPNGATYSMSIFENLTLSGHAALTLTGGNVQIVQAVPAPAGILLALTALPLFGVWSYRRKKQATQLAH
jgi:hypothetical protein